MTKSSGAGVVHPQGKVDDREVNIRAKRSLNILEVLILVGLRMRSKLRNTYEAGKFHDSQFRILIGTYNQFCFLIDFFGFGDSVISSVDREGDEGLIAFKHHVELTYLQCPPSTFLQSSPSPFFLQYGSERTKHVKRPRYDPYIQC